MSRDGKDLLQELSLVWGGGGSVEENGTELRVMGRFLRY